MRLIFLFVLVFSGVFTRANAIELSCTNSGTLDREKTIIKETGPNIKRVNDHSLEVSYAKGKHEFKDQPPHEPLDGIHWFYCAFNANLKLHLIEKDDVDTFTGVLLNHDTGEIYEAGKTVSFSPDKKLYFAVSQVDGMYYETWAIYNSSGKKLWAGTSGITDSTGSIAIELKQPTWLPNNQLSAQTSCPTSKEYISITLATNNDHYEWLPKLKCQDN